MRSAQRSAPVGRAIQAGLVGPLAALFVASLGLRPQLVGLGPLLPEIQGSLGVSHGVAGSLATVTVLCMAAFALPAVRLAHVIGLRSAMATSLAAILVFGLARAAAPDFVLVLGATVGVGIGIGLGGALLPRAVRLIVPGRAGSATGLYVGGIQVGAAVAAGVAAPIAAVSDWRTALVAFAGATAVILAVWLIATRSQLAGDTDDRRPSFPTRSPVAWRVVGIFALNSLCYYGLATWLASAYVDRGWSETSAGGLVAIMNVASLPACFAIPWLSDRSAARRHRYVLATSLGTGAAIVGILVAPDAVVAWAALAGLALGALFPLAMTLPIDVSRRPADVAGHAAMMLTGGYAVAAVAPVSLGWMRDATGSFVPAFVLLAIGAAVLCVLSIGEFAPEPGPARS